MNEVALARASNGDLVAACRTDPPKRFSKTEFDHYCGLGVSVSKDHGGTWSKVHMLYEWGRHHPSMVLLPNGDLVMTYVVRLGYPPTSEGYQQYGIEAVVSHDNGERWDLDHRYILVTWHANETGPAAWIAGSQATSSLLLPDGSILTAFGTGYRAKALPSPKWRTAMDVGLVRWKPNPRPVNSVRAIADAPFNSRLRNEYDPSPSSHRARALRDRNIAAQEFGARIRSSAADEDPNLLLRDPYVEPVVTLRTIPAWVDMRWPKRHVIDEIRIHPGASCRPGWPVGLDAQSTPVDYRLQYLKDGIWVDLLPPVKNAVGYRHFKKGAQWDAEFQLIHKFPPTSVDNVRLLVLRSGDPGTRPESADRVVVPEQSRQTVLRSIEVFGAK